MAPRKISLPDISTTMEGPPEMSSMSSSSSPQSQRSSILVDSPQTPMTATTAWDSSLDSSILHSFDSDVSSPLLKKVLAEDMVIPLPFLGSSKLERAQSKERDIPEDPQRHLISSLDLVLSNEVLGHGSFCKVVKACSATNNKSFAVKMPHQNSQSSILRHEVMILSQLGEHKNIVKHYGLLSDNSGISGLILELYPQSMAAYVATATPADDNSPFVGLQLWLNWTVQLCQALSFLQANKIVHCDLKTDNILLSESNTAVIADFSSSHTTDELATTDSAHLSTTAFSFEFSAPELLANPDLVPNFSTDLYSLGLIMLHVATGNEPYHRAVKSFPQKRIWAMQGAALKACSAEDLARLSLVMSIMTSFLTTRDGLSVLIQQVRELRGQDLR